jgi:P-type Mg2+ transporter
MAILPKIRRPRTADEMAGIRVSPRVIDAARLTPAAALELLQSRPQGLSQEQAEERLEQYGPNVVAQEKRHTWLHLLGHALINPLVILLLILATVSLLTGDLKAATVMSAMVVLGVVLRLVQEAKADAAAAKLKAMIRVTATVFRDGTARELPLEELGPGDVLKLSAGDMIPADVRILTCKDLFVIQASLTGESLPIEKTEAPAEATHRSPLELTNVCFLGTSVESGTATALVVATGLETFLGAMSKVLAGPPV